MSLWGNVDASNNAPNFSGITGYKTTTSVANSQIAAVYGNTDIGATEANVALGVFGVDTTEITVATAGTHSGAHAGWIARRAFTGPIVSVTANAGAVGPAATAASYTLAITGGGVGNTGASIVVTTNAAGYITTINVNSGGSYTTTPVANTFGNTVFTITMGGRANRVQEECLVAMGSMVGDGSDDTYYPDA